MWLLTTLDSWAFIDAAIVSTGALALMWGMFRRIHWKLVIFLMAMIYWYNLPDSMLRENILTRDTAETLGGVAVGTVQLISDTDQYWRRCGLTGSACNRGKK